MSRIYQPCARLRGFLCPVGLLASALIQAAAADPFLHGFADPALRVDNNVAYLCVGKDLDPAHKGFAMPYWAMYSSIDMVNWKQEKIIDPELVSYMGKGNLNCWAADIAFKNDKFYFFFSNGGSSTGVLVADKPNGTYVDVLKKPLVEPANPHQSFYDPTIFTDDDGAQYLTFGRDGHLKGETENRHYKIAKMNPDLISFAEAPRDLMTDREYGFGASDRATDHSYFHKHKDTYYLSRDENYMTGKSVYGPFSNLRKTGQPGHACFVDFHGQNYHGYEFSDDQFNVRTYRQVMFTYLHYKDNGDMIDDQFFLKGKPGYLNGVGQYDANWDRIEAEWYFSLTGAEKRDRVQGGFEIQKITKDSVITFPKVRNLKANAQCSFQVSTANPKGATIVVHQGSADGPVLGTCSVPGGNAWDAYRSATCTLNNPAGTVDLCLTFAGADELLHLDWLTFAPAQ